MGAEGKSESVQSCASCGATIYPEHLDQGLAMRVGGQLLCHHCVQERSEGNPSSSPGGSSAGDLESLALAEESDKSDRSGRSSLHGFTGHNVAEAVMKESASLRRPLNPSGKGATRVRTFHCRLSEGAMHHLDQQVNVWLDNHPDIEIKFATTTVGTWEGKHAEANLIMSIFY